MSNDPVFVSSSQDGARFPVNGRAARMIYWLVTHEARIKKTKKGEVRFCFAGKSLSVHTTNVDDQI